MAFEQKPNSGSIFNNERKEQESHPDRTGSCNIDGRDYWVNGWLKKTKDGKPYLSLSFKPKDQQRAQQGQGRQQAPQQQGGYPNQSRDQQPGNNQRGGGGGPPRTNWDRDPDDQIPF